MDEETNKIKQHIDTEREELGRNLDEIEYRVKSATDLKAHFNKNTPKGLMAALKTMFVVQSEECAVCIPDGARLMLGGISAALQQAHGVSTAEPVTFRQLSANPATYRDAVEFKNGVKLCLQDLAEGQTVAVLALSLEEAGAQERRFTTAQAWSERGPSPR